MTIRKQDFKRLDEYLWEIPQDFRPDMHVPARLYADDAMLEDALGDRSVEQLVNTATLPGVVKYAIAMPDIHQGYGFCIGNVVATEYPKGIISPGGVGYDVNCLSGDSRILHQYGYYRPIAEMEADWGKAHLVCQNFAGGQDVTTPVVRYLKLRPANLVYRLTTEAGDEVVATADHPFWTPDGMTEVHHLRPGGQVAVYPFEGVPYEAPSGDVIVDEADIRDLLARLGKGAQGNSLGQAIAHLKRRGLLPLRYDSSQLPALIKALGFIFGDGNVHFAGRRCKGVVWFFGLAEDLEAIRADVAAIGFTPSRVYIRERQHHITTAYGEYEFTHTEHSFKVSSTALAALLVALGAPFGKKAGQDYKLPAWLIRAPLWHKRLFLAALFGAELSRPQTFTKHGYNFPTPFLSLNKREGYVASGVAFLEGIRGLLAEFGVATHKISRRTEQRNADDSYSHRLRLMVSSRPDNLIRFWGQVGFEYNRKRQALANAAVQYLKHKSRVLALREETAEAAMAMRVAGVAPQDIYRELAGTYVNQRFLERSLYGGRATGARVSSAFPTFEAYCQEATAGLGTSGMVWERIAHIEPIPFDGEVYDFTVAHPDHNFVANGFVVSNCGVRLLASNLDRERVAPYLADLATALYQNCPSGVGVEGHVPLSARELERVMVEGAEWTLHHGYARPEDLPHTEENGRMPGADPARVSKKAKDRGKDQLGTLGAGNHFIEVDEVSEVYDQALADRLGLFKGQVCIQIHCGSRGFGHQVCTDYVSTFQKVIHQYGIKLPDRELVCAPLDSPEGQDYFAAMVCAANYAFANRQVLVYHIRHSFEQALAGKIKNWDLRQVYDIAHNIAKLETHVIDGKPTRVCVHRKGATRAFGPGNPVLPDDYRDIGQPVLVPGSMGTASFVLLGTTGSMEQTFGSTCHGAGRVMSRAQAKREVRGEKLREQLEHDGIEVRAGSMAGLAEEAPAAYKDVDRVVHVVHGAGIARKVAKLEPVAVIKG
jgi:tRNA-splicing ligase RtcB